MNGSTRDVARLHILARSMPEDEILGLLPVFYANLDPALIPSLETLDEILTTSTRLPTIQNAEESLSALAIVLRPERFPLDAAPEIWSRVWPWIEFLQLYYDCGPPRTTGQVVAAHLIFTQIIVKFSDHEPTSAVMFATKGVRRILAVSWATGVHKKYEAEEPATIGVISMPLSGLADRITDLGHLEEIIDACGGSFNALARTLVKNISQAVRHAKLPMAVTAIGPLFILLPQSTEVAPGFGNCLLSHGIVPALVSALEIDGVSVAGLNDPLGSIDASLGMNALIHILNLSPGYRWIIQAFRAGLLRRVVTSSARFATLADAGKYRDLLATVLPRALVSYVVVAEMKKVFVELEPLAQTAAFSRSCDRIDSKNLFKRCLTCSTASYCSRKCQRLDWNAGHRNECTFLRQATQGSEVYSEYADLGLHSHERSFIRALLDSGYHRLRLQISLEKLKFMIKHPSTPFFVAFDFNNGAMQHAVFPTAKLATVGLDDTPYLGRLARGGGRLTLHTLRLGHGLKWSDTMVPLRATSSRFHDGLMGIAHDMNGLPHAHPEVVARVRHLIAVTDKDTSYREIH
ncbi:hypothetical protein C8R46DRAFT_1286281 [Mycena filopes]|nr:hypothetical protein C8R46DRAFT_1286281 [Mycena filopes]